MGKFNYLMVSCGFIITLVSCESIIPEAPEENELLDGPVAGLSLEENRQFLLGDIAFNDEIFNSKTGLGPFFVATSCGSCHPGDGKGHPFTTLTRFGQADSTGNTFLGRGGPQLQNRALPGFEPEVIPSGATFSRFTPPANTGLGFLEALTDAQILSNADPNDINNDGISGVPNYNTPPDYFIPRADHISKNGKYIGRFGKKAAAINLLNQTVNAYREDIGITTDFAIDEPEIYNKPDQSPDEVPDPEIPASTVRNVVFYLRTLKAPVPRDGDNGEVILGKQLFIDIGCASCHIPEWISPQSDIAALSDKTFYPYTDLLLHDMGEGLDDNYTEGTALTSEWRTPPLWGLGLAFNSQGGSMFLLHDGRASTIEEAILLHGGEGEYSNQNFQSLVSPYKKAIIKFLKSL